ncbi:MAG: 3-oxoacyl-[acyl-carrier-protein] synthase 3 [Chlamydiia bacterium]|nr:3-oxoacyl-[acyl-carrier-protein] synthase 3 [Chlamydiia bacterium]
MVQKRAYISETSSYLPDTVMTNSQLEKVVETTDEWIVSRTGIKERRIAHKEEATSDLGVKAAHKLLEKAQLDISQVDLIIVATLSPDYIFPSTACIIQKKLKAKCPAFDVVAACSGMMFALATAKGYITSGLYKNIMVIAAEKVSSILDYTDRSTCVLFGDGACAALVTDKPLSDHAVWMDEIVLGSDGEMHQALEVPSGGSVEPLSKEALEEKRHCLRMDGRVVFRHAVKRMISSISECLKKGNIEIDEIDYFIPHQANNRIIEAILKRFMIDPQKVHRNVEYIGNVCAASVGICLDEYLEHRSKSDQNILMAAFGAGFTWGTMILKGEGR